MLICSYRTPHTAAALAALARQVDALHPGARTIVVDLCATTPPVEHAEMVDPAMLVDDDSVLDLAMIARTPEELAGYLAPFLVRFALRQTEQAVFVDPRTVLVSPLDQLGAEAEERGGLTLVARFEREMPANRFEPSPRDALARGIVNENLWAASRSGLEAIEWWCERMDASELSHRTGAVEDHPAFARSEEARRVHWCDALAALFGMRVASAEGWAESVWTLGDRPSGRATDGTLRHAGRPIRTIDLSELEVETPWLIAPRFHDAPRFQWSQHRDLWLACRDWIHEVADLRRTTPPAPYRYGVLEDGTHVDPRMRRIFERGLLSEDPVPGNPLAAGQARIFVDWLDEEPGNSRVSRYLLTIWNERADLQAAFPRAAHEDAEDFLGWVEAHGIEEESVPEAFRPTGPPPPMPGTSAEAERLDIERAAPPAVVAPERGVLVSGYLNSVMGLGEAARLVVGAVERSGVQHATFTYTAAAAQQADEFLERGDHAVRFDTHIACVNIDTFTTFAGDVGPRFFDGRHTIGLWFWETSIVPESMLPAFDLVDEVWVACQYVRDVLGRYTDKPIHVYPQPVPVPARGEASRTELGLPDAFTFLFAFDFNSVLERKNPLGLIRAFTRSFEPGEGPQLVLKTINAGKHVPAFERLMLETFGRPDIHVVDEFFPSWKRDAWTAECDCYVSLHRSEGFGLTMAEAMASGKPVIATRYGGNLEFMDDGNSLLVDAGETTVPSGCPPYPVGAVWADPDFEHAARHMRTVYEDEALRRRLGAAARERITTRHSQAAMADWIQLRLETRWAVAAAPTAPATKRPLVRRLTQKLRR